MKTNLIYYPGGCYGTFLEWCCNFFSVDGTENEFPFLSTGSSHKFDGNWLWPPEFLHKYIESDITLPLARCHPSIFEKPNSHDTFKNNTLFDIVSTDIDFLSQNFRKIVVCHPSESSYLWLENNQLDKFVIEDKDQWRQHFEPWGYEWGYNQDILLVADDKKLRFSTILKNELDLKNIQQWKHNIDDFDMWELRELLSLYWFNRIKDSMSCWDTLKQKYPDISFVSLNDLKYKFSETVIDYLNYLDIKIDSTKLSRLAELEHEWKKIQYHINKDKLVNDIVQNLINQQDFKWNQLSIIDEAYIQKLLRDQGIEIKCWNLNTFPTNTKDFLPYLEYP